MKTKQQAQIIFDTLVSKLKFANRYGLHYVTRNISGVRKNIQNPLEKFLTSMQEELAPEDFDREFLSLVYAEAFHTGGIPKNCNHIAMTSALTLYLQPTAPLLQFWIDLDKVTALINTHFRINPPYRFRLEYGATSSQSFGGYSGGVPLTAQTSTAVNSVFNTSKRNADFLLGCIISGIISGYALLIAVLAVASLVTFSTAVGVGILAGVVSYGFFKATYVTTSSVCHEVQPEDIEEIFQQHFAAIISPPGGGEVPQERVEIIEELALNFYQGSH